MKYLKIKFTKIYKIYMKQIKILLRNTRKTWTNIEAYHVHGKEDSIL